MHEGRENDHSLLVIVIPKSTLRGDQIHVWEAFQVQDKHRYISAHLQLLSSTNEGKAGGYSSYVITYGSSTGKRIVSTEGTMILQFTHGHVFQEIKRQFLFSSSFNLL